MLSRAISIVHLFFIMENTIIPATNQTVLIHCNPSYLPEIKRLNLDYVEYDTQVTVRVPDVEYTVVDGYYQDPDEQMCEHYGIDYDQVYCMESC